MPIANALASSFLAGRPGAAESSARAERTLGKSWRWLRNLAARYTNAFDGKTRPRHRDVVRFLWRDAGFRRAWAKYRHELHIEQRMLEPQQMQPAPALSAWSIPPIESVSARANWLSIDINQLDWFADLKRLAARKPANRLHHYHYKILPKRSGDPRLIEAPKPRLKQIQRRILTGILDQTNVHPAAHGFVHGRSIKTFVAPHVGQSVVLRMDLRDFFPSITGPRIQALFRTLGYPEPVADILGGICTNTVPRQAWTKPRFEIDPIRLAEARRFYARPHLPQGAPTSPALANLAAYRLDCRLTGLAKSAGAQYTRYADDLAFSGNEDFARRADRFSTHVAAILLEEGFAANHHKTRILRQAVRQKLAGLVVNECTNIPRAGFDQLKAILTNCVRHGPASQNREAHPQFRAHLEGRVAFVESIHPPKGQRLRTIFAAIVW